MTNILIRDLDPEDLERLDRQAADLGLSRNELVRRNLTDLARRSPRTVTVEDMSRAAHLSRDLLDEDVMRGAWD